ncbi:MAG: hypothetical protein ACFFEY_03580 [Candidatus Thorarchaeota archaeon]
MDTGTDFIRPEFLNILFFQQKNLVIFPYVDVKHLHALEIFTIGYTVIDLESTALHNIKEILEFEKDNSYSQNPTLFFISNANFGKVKEIMELNGIHCIINSNENISELADGSKFIFFNKKSGQFLNYNIMDSELVFENHLILESADEQILQDKIQKIKIAATRIFKEINTTGNLQHLSDILYDYDKKYWDSILKFTRNYFDINIPNISEIKFLPHNKLKDFSEEYEIIISTNRQIGKEFIHLMHNYREKKVNPAHLELEELYFPQKLYNYLRNHHWKEGIPEDFILRWISMENSGYTLTEQDHIDFDTIFNYLGIINKFLPKNKVIELKIRKEKIPYRINDMETYKPWILNKIDYIEINIGNVIDLGVKESFLQELSEIMKLIGKNKEIQKYPIHTKQHKKGELLVVDITNILNDDKNEFGKLKIENILLVRDSLLSLGFEPLMIADANMRHYPLDNPQLYEELLNRRIVAQAPAGRKADGFVLEFTKAENCKFLSNDMYKDYYNEFGKEWIFNHRLVGKFLNSKFILR